MGNYIFNLETTKIELYFERSDYDALSAQHKSLLKSAFLWSRSKQCWVSRAKEPNLWRAKEIAKTLGFTSEQREGERLSYAEQLERQSERAEARAERFEQYAENAEARAERLQKPIDDMHGDIAFFTQPNINTSSGRAFTRRREKMFEQYERGFDEYRKSAHFRERAATALDTASMERFKDPAYLDRRIKECKKEIRDRERNIVHYEETLYDIEQGKTHTSILTREPLTAGEVSEWIERELELVEKAMDKQAYLENCLDEIGGMKFSRDNIKVGYIVRMPHYDECEIVSTGPVNVIYKILRGGAAGFTLKAAYAEIVEVIRAEEKKKGKHPFEVGEKFPVTRYVLRSVNGSSSYVKEKVEYEIIKASDTTIKLQIVGSDEKPITRKPSICATGKWSFSIDNSYQNTFFKDTETA